MSVLLSASDLRVTLARIAAEIARTFGQNGPGALVGIRRRGDVLADRLARILAQDHELTDVPLGALDITLYRDDLAEIGPNAVVRQTLIDFPIADKTVVLVDDVLHTGRTIRAALTSIADLGRPSAVRLAVLCDRPGRELPIQPDICGVKVGPVDGQVVVRLEEVDGVDEVTIE